jgi:hypothetical protein
MKEYQKFLYVLIAAFFIISDFFALTSFNNLVLLLLYSFIFYVINFQLKNHKLIANMVFCWYLIGDVSRYFLKDFTEEDYIFFHAFLYYALAFYFFAKRKFTLDKKVFLDFGFILFVACVSLSIIVLIQSYDKPIWIDYACHYFYGLAFLLLSSILFLYFNLLKSRIRIFYGISIVFLVLFDLFFAIQHHIYQEIIFKYIYLIAKLGFYYTLLIIFTKLEKKSFTSNKSL